MNNGFIISNKRKLESPTSDQPLKRIETEAPCYFESMKAEAIGHIFSFLTLEDLLVCDRVSKTFSFFVNVNGCFSTLMRDERLNLEWSFSRLTANPGKTNYIVNLFFKKFLKRVSGSTYFGYAEKFTSTLILQNEICSLFERLKTTFVKVEIQPDLNYSGDLLLQGLNELHEGKIDSISKAIDKKGTFASYMAVKVFMSTWAKSKEAMKPFFMLCQLAAKKEDFRALDLLLGYNSSKNADMEEMDITECDASLNLYGKKPNSSRLLRIALVKAKNGDALGALELINKALKTHKKTPGRILEKIGDIFAELNEYEKALEFYQAAKQSYETNTLKKFPILLSQKFFSHLSFDRLIFKKFSITNFKNNDTNPFSLSSYKYVKLFLAKARAPLLVKIADSETKLGYFDEAYKTYESAIEDFKTSSLSSLPVACPDSVLEKLGDAFTQGNQLSLALMQYEEALRTNPKSISLAQKRADIFFKMDNFPKARMLYQNVISLLQAEGKKIDRTIYNNLGFSFLNLKDYDRASKMFKLALLENDKEPIIHENLAAVYIEKGKLDKALKHYLLAVDSYFENNQFESAAIAYTKAGDVCSQLKDFNQAAKLYNFALGHFGDKAPCNLLARVANAYFELKDFEKAVKFYEMALTVGNDPQGQFLANYAEAELNLGHKDKALFLFQKAVAHFGDNIPDGLLNKIKEL